MSPVFISGREDGVYERSPSYFALLQKNNLSESESEPSKTQEKKGKKHNTAREKRVSVGKETELKNVDETKTRGGKMIVETNIDDDDEEYEDVVCTNEQMTNPEVTVKKILHDETLDRGKQEKKLPCKPEECGGSELADTCSEDLTHTLTTLFPHYFQPDGKRKENERRSKRKKKKRGEDSIVAHDESHQEVRREESTEHVQTTSQKNRIILREDTERWTIDRTPEKKPIDEEINRYIEKQSTSIKRNSGSWERQSASSSVERAMWLANSVTNDRITKTKEVCNSDAKTVNKCDKNNRPLSGILKTTPQKSAAKSRKDERTEEGTQSESDLIDVLFLFHDDSEEDSARRSIGGKRTNTTSKSTSDSRSVNRGERVSFCASDDNEVFLPQKDNTNNADVSPHGAEGEKVTPVETNVVIVKREEDEGTTGKRSTGNKSVNFIPLTMAVMNDTIVEQKPF